MLWLRKLLSRQVAPQPHQCALRRAAKTSARDEARKFLRETLAAGPAPAEELLHQARKVGHAEKTLRRAKVDLGIRAYRVGRGSAQRWFWILAEAEQPDSHHGHTCRSGTTSLEIANAQAAETADLTISADMAMLAPEEAPAGDEGNSDISHDSSVRPGQGDGRAPSGFILPLGVECVQWEVKSAPVSLRRGGLPVSRMEEFIASHLEIMAAKLRGERGWLCEQWTVDTLLDDLHDVGVDLRIR